MVFQRDHEFDDVMNMRSAGIRGTYQSHFPSLAALKEGVLLKEALNYIVQGSDISVVVGRPGTGKSYLLQPVKDYFEANNAVVIGAALSGKVAKAMQTETGIESSTIASLAYRLTHNKMHLTNKHVLIIDEAGMVDFNNMALLIHAAKQSADYLDKQHQVTKQYRQLLQDAKTKKWTSLFYPKTLCAGAKTLTQDNGFALSFAVNKAKRYQDHQHLKWSYK